MYQAAIGGMNFFTQVSSFPPKRAHYIEVKAVGEGEDLKSWQELEQDCAA
jgi:hypothetical protein